MMVRMRLVAFAAGLTVAGAAIGQFVWKDLWADSLSLSSQMKHQFAVLDARVSDLESLVSHQSNLVENEG